MLTTPASAEWVKLLEKTIEGNETVFYVDPLTIRRDGHFRRIWVLHEWKERDHGALSGRLLHEYDCKEERIRTLAFTVHSERMAEGRILSYDDRIEDWQYIAPGSIGETYLKFACTQ